MWDQALELVLTARGKVPAKMLSGTIFLSAPPQTIDTTGSSGYCWRTSEHTSEVMLKRYDRGS